MGVQFEDDDGANGLTNDWVEEEYVDNMIEGR